MKIIDIFKYLRGGSSDMKIIDTRHKVSLWQYKVFSWLMIILILAICSNIL
jgi:hypothetical protein